MSLPLARTGGVKRRWNDPLQASVTMLGKTVLIVDDDAPTREALAEFLAECGYRVIQAAHGGEAILHVYLHGPDVVLLDLQMPVLDGVEVAESLRARAPTARMRILGITGCESGLQRQRLHAVCDDVLTKPCAPELIAARIRALVEVAA
jgi:two-component system phosphate regulon response regulator PhoB